MSDSTGGASTSASADQGEKKLSIADIIDNQLEASDEIKIGRVADFEAEWREDGSLAHRPMW